MFPTDPRQMQALMRQLGIKVKPVEAKRVVIECEGSSIIIDSPKGMEMSDAKGVPTYTISGKVREELPLSEEDIQLVMEGTGATREQAIEALKKHGDVASAIVAIKG
ncbi:MAG: nascent polypeptide-associated complex protein [Candidatus Micrarchaeota archaeon]|nr:nascent polypeptide-associated complex protein [Candidatus Micrarchaeota archaeon]